MTRNIDTRAVIIAAKGNKIIVADAEQIEARITLWLAGDFDQLAKVKKGVSVYQAFAEKLGWPPDRDLKTEDPDLYFTRKQQKLGLGFQCGGEKYYKHCQNLDRPITLMEAKRQVKEYRAKEPLVVALWREKQTEIDEVARANGFAKLKGKPLEDYIRELPSGRELLYIQPHYQQPKDDKRSFFGPEVVAQTTYGGPFRHLFGGKLLENEVQAIARDILGLMILRLDDAGHQVLFTSHDELVLEVGKDVDPIAIKLLLDTTPIPWAEGLPITVDVNEGTHYFKK